MSMNIVLGVTETDRKKTNYSGKTGKLPYDQNWTHAVPNWEPTTWGMVQSFSAVMFSLLNTHNSLHVAENFAKYCHCEVH